MFVNRESVSQSVTHSPFLVHETRGAAIEDEEAMVIDVPQLLLNATQETIVVSRNILQTSGKKDRVLSRVTTLRSTATPKPAST